MGTKHSYVNPLSILCVILSLVLLVGCATLFKGKDQKVKISSSPDSARVVIKTTGGVQISEGRTPMVARVSKKNEYVVTVSLPNYKDASVTILKDGIEGWFWGNILCGGIIGIIIDASNGAMNELSPNEISVTLLTAYNSQNREQVLYAAFQAYDNEGNLRHMYYPLERIAQ